MASQNMNITRMSSAVTSPYIVPAKASRRAAKRPRPGSSSGEVPGAVDEHERADAGDDEREQPGERVDPEGERDPELRDPRERFGHRAAGEHGGRLGEGVPERRERQHRDQVEHPRGQQPREEPGGTRNSEEGQQDQRHGGLSVLCVRSSQFNGRTEQRRPDRPPGPSGGRRFTAARDLRAQVQRSRARRRARRAPGRCSPPAGH